MAVEMYSLVTCDRCGRELEKIYGKKDDREDPPVAQIVSMNFDDPENSVNVEFVHLCRKCKKRVWSLVSAILLVDESKRKVDEEKPSKEKSR